MLCFSRVAGAFDIIFLVLGVFMSYISDKIVEALGGSKWTGSGIEDYGSYSPNGIRSIVVAIDCIIVEYHPAYKKNNTLSFSALDSDKVIKEFSENHEVFKKALNVLSSKKLMTLEEIVLDSALGIDPNVYIGRIMDSKARLRSVSRVRWTPNPREVGVATNRLRSSYREFRQQKPEGLLSEFLPGGLVEQRLPGAGVSDWFARFALNPRDYKSDLKSGALYQYFAGIARAHGVVKFIDSEMLVEGSQSFSMNENANLSGHKTNVEIDMGVEQSAMFQDVVSAVKVLQDAEHTPVSRLISSSLTETFFSKVSKRPGLGFYLKLVESVPESLVSVYSSMGFADMEEESASSSAVRSQSGYLGSVFTSSVYESLLRSLAKSAVDEHRFVVDKPSLYLLSLSAIDVRTVEAESGQSLRSLSGAYAHALEYGSVFAQLSQLFKSEPAVSKAGSDFVSAVYEFITNATFVAMVQSSDKRVIERSFYPLAVSVFDRLGVPPSPVDSAFEVLADRYRQVNDSASADASKVSAVVESVVSAVGGAEVLSVVDSAVSAVEPFGGVSALVGVAQRLNLVSSPPVPVSAGFWTVFTQRYPSIASVVLSAGCVEVVEVSEGVGVDSSRLVSVVLLTPYALATLLGTYVVPLYTLPFKPLPFSVQLGNLSSAEEIATVANYVRDYAESGVVPEFSE